jgi:hypothetical protein
VRPAGIGRFGHASRRANIGYFRRHANTILSAQRLEAVGNAFRKQEVHSIKLMEAHNEGHIWLAVLFVIFAFGFCP